MSTATQGTSTAEDRAAEAAGAKQPAGSQPAERKGRQERESSTRSEVLLDCRVLVAEDAPDSQRLISLLLEKAGAEVTVADNGQVARDYGRAANDEGVPFDVILMDMHMPVMDGREATRQLRQAGYTGPIVALTASAMTGDEKKCRAAGCDDFATKPIDRRTLIEVVKKHVDRRRGEMDAAGDCRGE